MAVMNRQPGLTWDDVGGMQIPYFFHVLRLSEKQSGAEDVGEKLSKKRKRDG